MSKKPARKPINASTKKLYRIKQRTLSIRMDSWHKFTGVDKEHTFLQEVNQLLWQLGLWVELTLLLGVVILKIMI